MNRSEQERTHVVRAWLAEGSTELSQRVIDGVFREFPRMSQDRPFRSMPSRPAGADSRTPVPTSAPPSGLSLAAPIALAAAVVVVALIGVSLLTGNNPGGHPGSPPSSPLPSPSHRADLGVFEPIRGRIVFRDEDHFLAVDPLDPFSVLVIQPTNQALSDKAMPAGWSADGSKLAVSDEYRGRSYVMDQTGTLEQVPLGELNPSLGGGCCWFVPSAWLSPDGNEGLFGFARGPQGQSGGLYLVDLEDIGRSRLLDVEFGSPGIPIWSPDGTQAAYTWRKGGLETTTVSIVDLADGTSRELVSGWGLIRQMAWSPDDSQLLVVAGERARCYGCNPGLNPLVQSQQANLYAVDIDDGEVHEIASGRYIAVAWSPDGTQIAAIDYPGSRKVVVLNADGSGAPRVLAVLDEGLFNGVVWHPVPVP